MSDCFRRTAVHTTDEEAATLRVSASRPPTRMNASVIAAFWTLLGPYAPARRDGYRPAANQ
jgi:hypothetical protein